MSWECVSGINKGIPHCSCNLSKPEPTCCYCHKPISSKHKPEGGRGVWSAEPTLYEPMFYDIETSPGVSWQTVSTGYGTTAPNNNAYFQAFSNPAPDSLQWLSELYFDKTKKAKTAPVQEDTCDDDGSDENID